MNGRSVPAGAAFYPEEGPASGGLPVGVLALQGCVDPHLRLLGSLGAAAVRVRTAAELDGVSRLIIPGGESTTMIVLLTRDDMWEPLRRFADSRPVWGVCAGAILLAREVRNPTQASLGVMPVRAVRNAYGSQLDSFEASVLLRESLVPVHFIRAPKLEILEHAGADETVEVLATDGGSPVAVRSGRHLATTFHPELGDDPSFHSYFLSC